MRKPLDLNAIREIIVPLRERGDSWRAVAKALNAAGLETSMGMKWSAANAARIGILELGVPRVYNTPTEPAAGGHGQNAQKVKRSTRKGVGFAYAEIDDVLTSNLSPKLKLKLIGLLAGINV